LASSLAHLTTQNR